MKTPSDKIAIQLHEIGHAMFGLVDTYDGKTYYYQSEKYPNVWSSEFSCRAYASETGKNPDKCREIGSNGWWKWDDAPDIMAYHYKGKFGEMATKRINYVLEKVE
jgi:hypothetical protein